MDGFVEEAFASALGVLAITRILFDVGDHTRIKNALSIGSGVKATVEIDISTSEVQANLFGHLLQRFQALWEQEVAYPLAADNVLRPLPCPLIGGNQPVMRTRNRFS